MIENSKNIKRVSFELPADVSVPDLDEILRGCNQAWLTQSYDVMGEETVERDIIKFHAITRNEDFLYRAYTWLRSFKYFKLTSLSKASIKSLNNVKKRKKS